VAEYRGYIQHAIRVLADDNAVHIAREATHRLLGGLDGLRYPGSARAPARRVD
jgi:heme A synthase